MTDGFTARKKMYLIPVEVKESSIEGSGVFALSKITRGEIIWKFDSEHDKTLSVEEFKKLDEKARVELERVAYLSPWSRRYVYPPEGDPARFTNHSKDSNLSAVFDKNVSPEPYFVSKRDIEKGEELTNNYFEFDGMLETHKPKWM